MRTVVQVRDEPRSTITVSPGFNLPGGTGDVLLIFDEAQSAMIRDTLADGGPLAWNIRAAVVGPLIDAMQGARIETGS